MGNTTIASWSNGEYIKLSGLLYRNTAVQISPSTLKRIFGKVKTTERYYPQKATRDALAQYAGFSNWDRFVSEQNNTIPINETGTSILVDRPLINPPASASPSRKSRIKRYRIIIVLLAIGAALLLFRQITKTKNSSAPDLAGAKLICKNPIGENPHSAEFIVRLPDQFSGDTSKFKVDFDDRRSEKNVPANKTFTYYYELPGSHYAILKYDGVPVDTAVILLRTNGWNATGVMQHDTTRVYPLTEFIIDGVKPLTVTP
ncbi:MAG: hypothetical protein J7539_17270, partial [Niabella sp.]|nr:hypothetical protein [Niabella sp.]